MSIQGVAFYDARADLRRPRDEIRRCYLGAAAPTAQIYHNRSALARGLAY